MDDDLKVGYVLAAYPVLSETFILNELLAHEAAGLRLEIFSLGPALGGEVQELFRRVRTQPQYVAASEVSSGGDLGALASRLAKWAAAQSVTHLHAHFGAEATEVARLAARELGISYSFTAHAVDIFRVDIDRARLARMFEEAAFAVTISEYNRTYLRDELGITGEVELVRNGLDLERFEYVPPAEREPHIVAAGRLVEKKGFAYLLEACALLVTRGVTFRCTIVGAGPFDESLRAQSRALGLEDRVTFTGALSQDEVLAQMRSGAVFVAPCVVAQDGNRDGLPTVLLEAMASGTPVIATDVTGIPEAVRDGQTGMLCPQRDARGLGAAIARLLNDPELRVRLASNARALIERQFEVHRNTARLRKLFHPAAQPDG